MELTFWPRAIGLGALACAAVLVVAACGLPAEPKPVTDAEPTPSETIVSGEEQNDELRSEESESEFVDPEPTPTVDLTATSASDGDVEKEGEFVDPEPTPTVDLTATSASDGDAEKEGEYVDPEPTPTVDLTVASVSDGDVEKEGEYVDPEPTPTVGTTDTSASDSDVEIESTVDDTGQEIVVDETEVETEAHGIFDDHVGAAVASVEERIFHSDVIVRASLTASTHGALTFRAIEYLKGTGSNEFTVVAATEGRDEMWDSHEAILFLRQPDSTGGGGANVGTFEFADTTSFDYRPRYYDVTTYSGDLHYGYTIDSANPVWLPSESALKMDGQSPSDRTFITASRSVLGDPYPTISLSALRAKIAWIEGGEDIEGYDECIRDGLAYIREMRDSEAYFGEPDDVYYEVKWLASGAPSFVLEGYGGHVFEDPQYTRYWLEGEVAALFSMDVVDDDTDPANGYSVALTTARPLPAGTYEIVVRVQSHRYQPCNFTYPGRTGYVANVIAPEGTVHEALFDPAVLTVGVGFSSDGGTLAPSGLSAEGGSTTVTGIRWVNGSLVLTLDPFVDLGGQDLYFIGLDGSTGLTLSVSSAIVDEEKGSLTWAVADRPWESGDRLMLRIWSPPDTESRVAVSDAETMSAGWGYTCRLEADGLAVCWGRNDDGQSSPPSGERFVAISAGNSHACGLREDGVAVCWGAVFGGQLDPPPGKVFETISAGSGHTCGLGADGAAVCWGPEFDGELSPPEGERFVAISAGGGHTCGLRADGVAVCWGTDFYGETSPPEGQRFVAISAGSSHSCGLRADGATWCWGSDYTGQTRRPGPSGERFVAIAAGGHHTCGLRGDGAAVCWGDDPYGQSSPPEDERFVAIAAGDYHTCGQRADGQAVCWGLWF